MSDTVRVKFKIFNRYVHFPEIPLDQEMIDTTNIVAL